MNSSSKDRRTDVNSEHRPTFRDLLGLTDQAEPRIFEVGEDQTYVFRGYSVTEIADLYALHQNHIKAVMSMARDFQDGADAVHYTPVGPEDITASLDGTEQSRRRH